MRLLYGLSLIKSRPSFRLIPKLHAERHAIADQMKRVRVSVAAKIEQIFILNLGNITHVGRSGNGEVTFQRTSNGLQFFMTEDVVEDSCPSEELVDLIAEHCKIEEKHRSILHTVLAQESNRKLLALFKKRGIYVDHMKVEGVIIDSFLRCAYRITYFYRRLILTPQMTSTLISTRKDTWRFREI